MKLLASVLSAAVADYACCPYDEFGIPETTCISVLNEKSPFSDTTGAGALVPVESYACKAWEANAGAMSESHKGGTVDDWGSCGFQRHFPWYHTYGSPDDDGNTHGADHGHKLGLWKDDGTANYEILAVNTLFAADGSANPNASFLSLTKGSFSGESVGSKPVVGDVHLGAICKLFVPVTKSFIRQVSIAGVHVNNARIGGGSAWAISTEFNAAVIGNTRVDGDRHRADYHAGTAYCFSVVNIAEFMTNRANNIANANVAGQDLTARGTTEETDADGNTITLNTGYEWFGDDVGLKYDADGDQSDAQFGTVWPGHDQSTSFMNNKGNAANKNSGQHKVNMGSNFDVVVHFESSWCAAHWNLVDMQKEKDHGGLAADESFSSSMSEDYPNLVPFDKATNEGLMDAWDKRLPAAIGSCGMCYDKASAGRGVNNGNTKAASECADQQVLGFADEGAGTDEVLTGGTLGNAFNMPYSETAGTCNDLNGYVPDEDHRWPNAGAWAAFYSFITCARADYMIYGPATRGSRDVIINPDGERHLEEIPEGDSEGDFGTFDSRTTASNNDNRMVVVGGWHQDYRHGVGACVRFNLRQVGTHVQYCADGDEERFNKNPTTDGNNPTGDTSGWSQNGPTRCTWNWNYNILSQGDDKFDAEAWFDSVDPLHRQVWIEEKFTDEPLPGKVSDEAQNYAAVTGTLTSDLTIVVMIQQKAGSAENSFVAPSQLEMDSPWDESGYMVASDVVEFAGDDIDGLPIAVFDTSDGAYATITVKCRDDTTSTDPVSAYRSSFPDCFFGDEIHGQWTWSDGLEDIDAASQTNIWRFWAMIKSHE